MRSEKTMAVGIWFLVFVISLLKCSRCEDISRVKRDDSEKIIVTTIVEEPYVMLKSLNGSGNENFDGFIPEMMKELSDKLQLDYELRLVADGKYGGVDKYGVWNGMIGEILNGVADMAAAPMTISSRRERVVDFTKPFESSGIVLLMLKQKEGETLTIKNIEDLANQDEVKYGIVKNGATEDFFRISNIEICKKIWKNMSDNPQNMVSSVNEGVHKVRDSDGKFAFIMESATAEYWVNKAPCNLEIIGNPINSIGHAFAFKIDDDKLDVLNMAILQMAESGDLHMLHQKWKKRECENLIVDDRSAASSICTIAGIIVVVSSLTSHIL